MRRRRHRFGRDLMPKTTMGKGLAALGLGLAGFLGFRRYKQPKVGDTVVVDLSQAPVSSLTQLMGLKQIQGKVVAVGPAQSGSPGVQSVLGPDGKTFIDNGLSPGSPSVTIAPIAGGTVMPATVTVPDRAVIQNLTPHL